MQPVWHLWIVVAIIVTLLLLGRSREGWIGFKKRKYALLGKTDFPGNDFHSTTVTKTRECQKLCDELSGCKAFTVDLRKTDGKMSCFLKGDEQVRPGNRKRNQTKTTYVEQKHWDYWKGQGLQANSKDEDGRGCFDKIEIFKDNNFQNSLGQLGCGLHNVKGLGISSIKIPSTLRVHITTENFDKDRALADEARGPGWYLNWTSKDQPSFTYMNDKIGWLWVTSEAWIKKRYPEGEKLNDEW